MIGIGAGIVDEDVDAAEAIHHRLDHAIDKLFVGHITGEGQHDCSLGSGQRSCFLQAVCVAGDQPKACAFSSHRDGDGPTHTGACTGDDSHFPA